MILGQAPQDAATDSADNMNDSVNEGESESEAAAPVEADESEAVQPHEECFELDKILEPVGQFLSPLVRAELGKTLAPVISKANAGPVEKIIEIERIIEVAPGEKPRVTVAKARREKRVPFRTLFPSKKTEMWRDSLVTLWTGVTAPVIDPFYVADHYQAAILMTAIERGGNGWLTGPSGAGKSTLPQHIAAMTGRPFVRIGFTGQTEVELLVGSVGLHNGSTHWVDGSLVKAMREPGTIILLDELTFRPTCRPLSNPLPTSIGLSRFLLEKLSEPPMGFALSLPITLTALATRAACMRERRLATWPSSIALAACSRSITFHRLARRRPSPATAALRLDAARHLSDFVADCRKLPSLQGVVVSLRNMVAFVQAVQDGFNSKEAFDVAISSRMPAAERATIEAKADLAWNDKFESLVHGKAVPARPSDSAASKAFPDDNGSY